MNLDYLKTYLLLVKLGSFSQVAKKLSISQPAVSFQIQKLEHDLGVRLINRSQKKISLTESGKRVLVFAQAVNNEEETLIREIEHMREEVGGELLVAASTAPGELILPAMVGEFIRRHPAVKAQIVVQDSMEVIAGVHEGNYEVGICGTAPPAEYGLQSFRMVGDEIILIVEPDHRLTTKERVSFADIENEPFIRREATSGTQRTVESLLSKAGHSFSRLTPHLIVGSSQAVISAVESGAGIAFISNLAAAKALKMGTVKQVYLSGIKLKRDFFCIYYAEHASSRLLREFIDFIRQAAGT
jgi:DNA-binding transcriptional LysR family regulator